MSFKFVFQEVYFGHLLLLLWLLLWLDALVLILRRFLVALLGMLHLLLLVLLGIVLLLLVLVTLVHGCGDHDGGRSEE